MFNIIHKAMMLFGLKLEMSSSSEDFLLMIEIQKDIPGIDRRKFFHYIGLGAAALAAPAIFDFGRREETARVASSLLQNPTLDDRFMLSELQFIKPSGDSLIQVVYADVWKQIMEATAVPPAMLNAREVSGFALSGARV